MCYRYPGGPIARVRQLVVIVIGGAYLGRSPMFDGNRRDFITLLGEPRPAVWNLIEQGVFEIGSHPGQNSC
jgi:hypothetical protein